MGTDELPAVSQGIPKMLTVYYKDGCTLKMPYLDSAGAIAFLKLEGDDWSHWEITEFKEKAELR